MSFFYRFLLGSFLLTLVVGCGGPTVVNVEGTVTCGGKPVENLFLSFVPDNGRPSWAVTDADGRYLLHYDRDREGATVGRHRVWVQFRPASPREERSPAQAVKLRPELAEILKKYGNRNESPLLVEVKENNQIVDLELN